MSWSQRPVLNAGIYPTGADIEETLDQIASLTDPGWVDYSTTFAWTSSGTAPALGNATVYAKYRRSDESDLVMVRFGITFGNTSTFGTGIYFFSLPVTASSEQVSFACGQGYALDTGVQEYGGVVKMETSTTIRIIPAVTNADTANNWGQTVPFTFGNGDIVRGQFTYQAA